MATAGYVLGHNFRLYLGAQAVGHADSCSYSYDVDTKEISDKDVDPGAILPSAVALILGKKRITFSSSGFVVESLLGVIASVGGYRTCLNAVHAGTLLVAKFTTDVSGDTVISANVFLTKISGTGDDGSEAKYSIEGKSTGTITVSTKV